MNAPFRCPFSRLAALHGAPWTLLLLFAAGVTSAVQLPDGLDMLPSDIEGDLTLSAEKMTMRSTDSECHVAFLPDEHRHSIEHMVEVVRVVVNHVAVYLWR